VGGVPQGTADAVGTSRRLYTFQWAIEGDANGRYWEDCTYVVQAEAFDDKGRAGAPRALTVVLNRTVPAVPAQLEGGRNGNGSMVDLQWKKNNAECDVLGYRVYRSTVAGGSSGGPWTQVTCVDQQGSYVDVADPSCLDDQAPSSTPLHYYVVGVDTDPNGALREGGRVFLTVSPGNDRPTAPTNLSACLGGTPDCNEPDGSPASEGATVVRWDPATDSEDSIAFYRIYRDGATYGSRYAVFFPAANRPLAWTDPDTPSDSHTYYVTAVASNFGESELSAPIVDFP
jgi:hypothetical protein